MDYKDYGLRYLRFGIYHNKQNHKQSFDIPRPFDILTRILSGEVDFIFPSGVIHAKEGDTVHIPMGTTYRMEWQGEHPANGAMHYQLSGGEIHYAEQKLNGVCLPLERLPQTPLEELLTAYTILSTCLPVMEQKGVPASQKRLLPATEYIRSHYSEPIRPEMLAARVGLSLPRFYAVFRREMGMCVTDFRNCVRVDVAIQLLLSTDLSIEEIAAAVGFESAIYFRRIFKASVGMTPTAYRRANQKT